MSSKVSVVITTLTGRKSSTLDCLKPLSDHFEVIVVKDVYNASKARNLGIAKAKGEIVVVMDDDLSFKPEDLLFLISKVEKGKFILSNATVIAYKEDFLKSGGYDERVFRVYHEDMEFIERIKKQGFRTEHYDVIKHIGGKFAWWKLLLLRFNLPFRLLLHNPKALLPEFLKGFATINPLRFAINMAFFIGIVYYAVKLRFERPGVYEFYKANHQRLTK